jgi:hypothetical protein
MIQRQWFPVAVPVRFPVVPTGSQNGGSGRPFRADGNHSRGNRYSGTMASSTKALLDKSREGVGCDPLR